MAYVRHVRNMENIAERSNMQFILHLTSTIRDSDKVSNDSVVAFIFYRKSFSQFSTAFCASVLAHYKKNHRKSSPKRKQSKPIQERRIKAETGLTSAH